MDAFIWAINVAMQFFKLQWSFPFRGQTFSFSMWQLFIFGFIATLVINLIRSFAE